MTDLVLEARGVGKRFCRDLRRAGRYALADGWRAFWGAAPTRALRAGEFWGVSGVDLEVRAGEAWAVVGANGAGKTTLLRLLAGVMLPDAGEVIRRGRVAALLRVGAGFQPVLSGRENLRLSARLWGVSQVEAVEEAVWDFAGLGEEVRDAAVKTYSSGMRARLAFAVAVHAQPDVLLIDEALAVGDQAFRAQCTERLRALRAGGCALVVVSHAPTQLRRLTERAVWLQGGREAGRGSTAEILDAYVDTAPGARGGPAPLGASGGEWESVEARREGGVVVVEGVGSCPVGGRVEAVLVRERQEVARCAWEVGPRWGTGGRRRLVGRLQGPEGDTLTLRLGDSERSLPWPGSAAPGAPCRARDLGVWACAGDGGVQRAGDSPARGVPERGFEVRRWAWSGSGARLGAWLDGGGARASGRAGHPGAWVVEAGERCRVELEVRAFEAIECWRVACFGQDAGVEVALEGGGRGELRVWVEFTAPRTPGRGRWSAVVDAAGRRVEVELGEVWVVGPVAEAVEVASWERSAHEVSGWSVEVPSNWKVGPEAEVAWEVPGTFARPELKWVWLSEGRAVARCESAEGWERWEGGSRVRARARHWLAGGAYEWNAYAQEVGRARTTAEVQERLGVCRVPERGVGALEGWWSATPLP